MTAPERVPLKWNGEIVGWATPGRWDFQEQSQELLDVEWLPEDQLPEGAKKLIKLVKEATVKGLSIGQD